MWQNSGQGSGSGSGANPPLTNWDDFCKQGKLFGMVPNIMDGSNNDVTSDFWNRCACVLCTPATCLCVVRTGRCLCVVHTRLCAQLESGKSRTSAAVSIAVSIAQQFANCRYEEDIKNAQSLGIQAFRLSIEWHRLEPQQGVIDMSAIKRYHEILDCIAAHGMTPSATLHHFVHPLWWHKMGAFEKEANIAHFVNYCALAAQHFGPRITLWYCAHGLCTMHASYACHEMLYTAWYYISAYIGQL